MKAILLSMFIVASTTIGMSQMYYSEKGEVSVSFSGDTVIVWNKNLRENCCSRFQFSTVFLDSNIIVITETDTIGLRCSCDCLFDLSVSFTGLGVGHFTAEVFRQYLQKYYRIPDTTIFIGSVEFQVDSIGTASYSLYSRQSACLRGELVKDESKLPTRFDLAVNHPNPFNPSTEITYSVPQAVHVSLKVYDVLGQEVRTLVDRFEQAGEKTARFTAEELPSGVYFYRLQAGTFTDTKKLILIR